jgi:hypothetical protein
MDKQDLLKSKTRSETMLKVQEYLQTHTLEQLTETYFIKAKRHSKYNNLVLLKYSQIDSPMSEEIVQECRGLILDESNNWSVVNYGMKKFFNYGEGFAAQINWDDACIQGKLDGSLIQLFYWDSAWMCATSGTPDGMCQVGDYGISFKDLFWKVWNQLGYKLPEDASRCYWFELCTLQNTVVVRYTESKLFYLGCRSLITMNEIELYPSELSLLNWTPAPRYHDMKGLDELLEVCKNSNVDTFGEGFVVVDRNFNRIKVKLDEYLRLFHFRWSMSKKSMLDCVRNNEGSEMLSRFPEMTQMYEDIKVKYLAFVKEYEEYYLDIKHINNMKVFASHATKHRHSGLLFAVKRGMADSIKEACLEMDIKHLMETLGIKDMTMAVSDLEENP